MACCNGIWKFQRNPLSNFYLQPMHPILQTHRLSLRRFTNSDEDAAFILSMNSQPEVLKYLHEPLLKDLDHAKEVLQSIILPQYENNLGRWAVHTKDNNEFIGWCGLKYRSETEDIDLGYRFLPSAWGKGYATEAAKACLDFGFKTLNLEKINACAHINNIASLTVLEKIDMLYTGDDIIDDCPVKSFEALRLNYV